MKKFSDFRQPKEVIKESTTGDLPMTILLVRKGIRIFPTGDRVALYTNSKLGVDVSIPYSHGAHSHMKGFGQLTKEDTELDEDYSVIRTLQGSLETGEPKEVIHGGASTKVQPATAKNILKLYSVLTQSNQKRVREMLHSGPKDFLKVAKFAQDSARNIGTPR